MGLTDIERLEMDLLSLDLSRSHYDEFRRYVWPGWTDAPHHTLLAQHLQQIEQYVATGGQEGIGRLMIFLPPRHGKSLNVSVLFPAWFLGRNPDRRVIIASCTDALAMSFSRQARNVILSNPYQNVFGELASDPNADVVRIADDSRSVESWSIADHQGGLVAAGVGGGLIGRGAHLAIIDDPFRSRKDAESKRVRDDIDAWYRSVLYSRLEKDAAIVLMHQRWHEDDLAGRLIRRMLEEDGADRWTILCLPALAEEWAAEVEVEDAAKALKQGWFRSVDALGREPGQALWPQKYSVEALERIKAVAGGYEFDALYQQRPRQREGALIKAHKIQIISLSALPDDLRIARYWDLAVSGRETADFIASGKVGRAPDGRIYILDVSKRRGPWADARAPMIDVMLEDDASVTQGIEVAGQQGGYYQELQRDARLQLRTLLPINPRDVGSKTVRANVWASRIEDGLVYMVRGPWNDEFMAECLAFPRGQYDDQVDAVSGAVQMLGGSGWTDWARQQLMDAEANSGA